MEKEGEVMCKCYWYHDGSCDSCCTDNFQCPNYRELVDSDVVELKDDNNFNKQLAETMDKYRRRFKSCPCNSVL